MGSKRFSGAEIGMIDKDDNRESFRQYVEGYFSTVNDPDEVELAFAADFSTVVHAKKQGTLISTEPVLIEKDHARSMLAGLIQKIRAMGLQWRGIAISITQSGQVNVCVTYR
jgi:hypothetical protein